MLNRRRILGFLAAAALGFGGIVSISCADGGSRYVDPARVVLERVIPQPPAAGSAGERAELDVMLKIQAARTPAQADRAKHDAKISVFTFADAVESPADFTAEKLPKVAEFFEQVGDAERVVVRPAKEKFDRPRPYVVEPRLKPVIEHLDSKAYPSGHATWSYAVGFVLADMLPERRAQILSRAAEFADNRVVAGVHYPSDVDAGRVSGSVLAAFLFASPVFREDEKVATAELRSTLKLPPLP